MDIELDELKPSVNNNDEVDPGVEVHPGNGSCSNHNTPSATEASRLLSDAQAAGSNGEHCTVADIPDDPSGQSLNKPVGKLGRLKKELNEPVCWNLKVWMLILISFLLIILTILLSIYFCSVYQEDVDDKYNVAEFVVPRFFHGNFTLLNKNLALDAQSQPTDPLLILQQNLTHIYTSSHALGRYFVNATVNPLRNSKSSVEYELKFMMPEEHKQLILYTLSKEMVYHVLLQELFDQDTGDPLYIEPSSLTMEVGS
ncbi:hypothetical protein PHYPO_G00054030 [Pangasianodon hypophthalmus]|uniref:SEA domain-containing protein n=1 Tax=Pangasianodon hypophthalmus TaxID=310915 RepID=A0A5N5M5V8_PANHP|nr:hypothetical protein PHYPO_G00054030 [Pangasianodon hypophthalmus]